MPDNCWVTTPNPGSNWGSILPDFSGGFGPACLNSDSYVDIAVCDCAIVNMPIFDSNAGWGDSSQGVGCVDILNKAFDKGFDEGFS